MQITDLVKKTAKKLKLKILCTSPTSCVFQDAEHGTVELPYWLVERINSLASEVNVRHEVTPKGITSVYDIKTDNWDD